MATEWQWQDIRPFDTSAVFSFCFESPNRFYITFWRLPSCLLHIYSERCKYHMNTIQYSINQVWVIMLFFPLYSYAITNFQLTFGPPWSFSLICCDPSLHTLFTFLLSIFCTIVAKKCWSEIAACYFALFKVPHNKVSLFLLCSWVCDWSKEITKHGASFKSAMSICQMCGAIPKMIRQDSFVDAHFILNAMALSQNIAWNTFVILLAELYKKWQIMDFKAYKFQFCFPPFSRHILLVGFYDPLVCCFGHVAGKMGKLWNQGFHLQHHKALK